MNAKHCLIGEKLTQYILHCGKNSYKFANLQSGIHILYSIKKPQSGLAEKTNAPASWLLM